MAATLTPTKDGAMPGVLLWIAWANISLPVPLSPVMRMGTSDCETLCAISRAAKNAGSPPTRSSKVKRAPDSTGLRPICLALETRGSCRQRRDVADGAGGVRARPCERGARQRAVDGQLLQIALGQRGARSPPDDQDQVPS